MTKRCATCDSLVDDHKHVRYTFKGNPNWYCTMACVSQALLK